MQYLTYTLLWIAHQREREMFYLMTHSTHFIYGYMASVICRHIGYSYRLTASVLLYAPSHRQDNTYHSLCYTSRGALPGTRNSSMGPPHEGSIQRPTAPWANTLPLSYVLLLNSTSDIELRLCPILDLHPFVNSTSDIELRLCPILDLHPFVNSTSDIELRLCPILDLHPFSE